MFHIVCYRWSRIKINTQYMCYNMSPSINIQVLGNSVKYIMPHPHMLYTKHWSNKKCFTKCFNFCTTVLCVLPHLRPFATFPSANWTPFISASATTFSPQLNYQPFFILLLNLRWGRTLSQVVTWMLFHPQSGSPHPCLNSAATVTDRGRLAALPVSLAGGGHFALLHTFGHL